MMILSFYFKTSHLDSDSLEVMKDIRVKFSLPMENQLSLDYSSMALGYNGEEPIKCYIYTTDPIFHLQEAELRCFADTVGCISWVQVTANGWSTAPFPNDKPIRQSTCLSNMASTSAPLGSCICDKENRCHCFCIGMLCNTK